MRKTTLLISAAGTAAAYHLLQTARERFPNSFRIVVTDTNPPHLIAASRIADESIQVSPIASSNYQNEMLALLKRVRADVFVPLIDSDLGLFPCDLAGLRTIMVRSTSPAAPTAALCSNKALMCEHLTTHHIPAPRCFRHDDINESDEYFVKPVDGFGSKGAGRKTGIDLCRMDVSSLIIQEICQGPEVTVEVFCAGGTIRTICRERIEVKSGVCTKARVFHDHDLHQAVERIAGTLQMPTASCLQFMRNSDEQWVVTDVNLRLGAGTSLSSAAGWHLSAAALAVWGEIDVDPLSFLSPLTREKYVVRVFEDVVTRG